MAITSINIFHDIDHRELRPETAGENIHLSEDDGSGNAVLNPKLAAGTGWTGPPTNLRPAWASRSAPTDLFNSIPAGNDIWDFTVADSANGVIFAADNISGSGIIYRSMDNGISWSIVFQDSNAGSILSITALTDQIILATNVGTGVIRSADGGSTWSFIDFAIGSNRDIVRIDETTAVMVNTSTAEVHRTTDAGLNWSAIPITASSWGIGIDSETGAVYTGSNSNFIVDKSTDAGATWANVTNQSLGGNIHDIDARNDVVFAVGYDGTNSRIMRSQDGGLTWENVFNPSNGKSLWAVDIIDDTTIIAIGTNIWIRSNDGGNSWNIISEGEDSRGLKYIGNGITLIGERDGNIWRTSNQLNSSSLQRIAALAGQYDDAADTIDVVPLDAPSRNYIAVELHNKQAQDTTTSYLIPHWYADADNFPTSVSYNLTGTTQNYAGWAVEYTNNGNNIQATRVVLIREMPDPSTLSGGDDTYTLTVDSMLSLSTVNAPPDTFSVVRFLRPQGLVQVNQYQAIQGGSEPDYSILNARKDTPITSAITDMVMNQRVIVGTIIGLGSNTVTSGTGGIDNIATKVR